jgi:amino acid permease
LESFQIERSNKNFIIVSLALSFSGTLIAILFQNINGYFGLLGGTAGVMMAGGFPALCYYKLKGLRTNNQKMLVVFTLAVVFFGIFGAILSVVYPST